MSDQGQKTEQPTQRCKDKAREEGRFAASREFVSGMQFLAFTALLVTSAVKLLQSSRVLVRQLIGRAFGAELTAKETSAYFTSVVAPALEPLMLAGGGLMVLGLAIHLGLTQMGFSFDRLAPDLSRLNPMRKLKELPRQNVPAFFQALILLPVFLYAVYAVASDHLAQFLVLPLMGFEAGVKTVGVAMEQLLWKAAFVIFLFGCVDLARQLRRHTGDMKRSKQEVRDEMKEMEGDPQIKARIRRIQRDLLRRQMMKEVAKATAVIVNPTHYAVAIRYQLDSMAAPKVVAKGKNYLAARIRQRAIENQVPIVENPPLARALYQSVEVGQDIPAHLYRAVAEILAYIYRIMNGRLPG
ncbi:MAG: EscU/YscU/HrcU family type III secretion system export apparatus switch protein [Acidobacteria bacterium]|nr:EscU/YscU/HrcU family type III secretion system export apparatus switch protein [Acidobacteriota bacterium]